MVTSERLWELLDESHRGAANAVTAGVLASALMTSRRQISSLTRELVEQGRPIVAGDRGIYVAETEEERQRCLRRLYARALGTLRRYARLKRAPIAEVLRQIEMEFGEEHRGLRG